jgi:hypothetical protein
MRIPAGILVLLALALVTAAAAQAQTVTIKVNSVATVQQVHNVAPKDKVNKGDWIYFKDLLLNIVPQFGKKKSQPVAFDAGTIRYTSATGRKMTCKVTFQGIGTLTYGGTVIDRKDGTTTFPILRGTGGFKGAKGTVTLHSGKHMQPNVFVVTVPGHPINMSGGGVA